MDEAVDDSDRHCLVREDLAPLPNGWLAVISRDRRSYRALISSKSTLVSAWSFGRVGVEIRAPRLDDGLVQQPGFGELVQRIVNGRQDTRIPEVTASPCNCSAMTWRSPMPESAEASSQLTHRWREPDSNPRSRFRHSPVSGPPLVISVTLPRFLSAKRKYPSRPGASVRIQLPWVEKHAATALGAERRRAPGHENSTKSSSRPRPRRAS